MASSSKTTTDIEEIRKWTEERNGVPAVVKGTGDGNGGVLRINFKNVGAENSLEEISWDEFSKVFKDRNLAFLYQDKTADGKTSRFFKLVQQGGGDR